VMCVYLERLKGRKSEALEDMTNDPMILELKNGKVYGGRLDEYYYNGGGVVALYYCRLLDKGNNTWVDHDITTRFEGKIVPDDMPDFWIADLKNILVLPQEYRHKLTLDDTLQIYIDPHFKPLQGIQCNWNPGEKWGPPEESHAPECDGRLHEALSFLVTLARLGVGHDAGDSKRSEDEERRRKESFDCIRRRLLMYGAKIP